VINAITHESMQMDVQVGGGAKALDQRDGAGVRFAAFEPYLFDQKGVMTRVRALVATPPR